MNLIENIEPGAEGEDQGVGTEEDYNINKDYIGPESKPVIDEDKKPSKKDSINRATQNKEGRPIGSAVDEPKKKKGLLNKIFGKKDKNK
jgi:penicillin-binding protein 1A